MVQATHPPPAERRGTRPLPPELLAAYWCDVWDWLLSPHCAGGSSADATAPPTAPTAQQQREEAGQSG